jgi:predicted nucleic acid-binding Zn ribbon protein
MHCPYCGNEHPEDMKFCPNTGKALVKKAEPKSISVNLSSPVTLIVLGVVIVLVVIMTVFAIQRSQQPILPAATLDLQGTLAALVNSTTAAQITLPPPVTATSTSTFIPPTNTVMVIPATARPLPSRTPPAGAYTACPNAYPSVLHEGDVAMVSLTPPVENNLRDKPGLDSVIKGSLEPGEEVNIVGGPSCMGVYVWWSVVSRSSGRAGWTAEGDWNNYWLVKVD